MSLIYLKEKIDENECIHHIIDNIYLGNCNARKFISEFNIKKIIQIGEEEETKHYVLLDNNIKIYTVNIPDNRNTNLSIYFQDVWYFLKNNNENVLIHCKMGTSRSVAFVISYLIKYKNMNFDQSLNFIKDIRKESIYTKPNIGFVKQLKKLEIDNTN
jgi:protein-tyrosine phosphatase